MAGGTGRVELWHPDEGWGVIVADGAPGPIWAHFSVIEGSSYRPLDIDDLVDVEWEPASQDDFDLRATWVRPSTPRPEERAP